MFYDVKIMNPQGKVKKVFSSQEIILKFFQYQEANKSLNTSSKNQIPSWVKKRLDKEYVMPSYNSVA
jgi:hypothetical protein